MQQSAEPLGSSIKATRVTGTTVYDISGETLGSVDDIVLDKVSGQAIYAIVSFGGFLGIGEKYHPLPWSSLTYDTDRGGYVVSVSRQQIESGPSFARDEQPDWDEPGYGSRLSAHYRPPSVDPALGERTPLGERPARKMRRSPEVRPDRGIPILLPR